KSNFGQQLPPPGRGLLRPPRHPGPARHDRQRSLLLLRPLCPGQTRSATPTHPHSHLDSAHQWQSRTLHPNCHSRVGLRPSLPELRRTASPSGSLDPPVQLASTAPCAQPKTTHQPIRSRCQQPLDTPQLKPTSDPTLKCTASTPAHAKAACAGGPGAEAVLHPDTPTQNLL